MTPPVDYDAEWFSRWQREAERCVKYRIPEEYDRESAVQHCMVIAWQASEQWDGRGTLEGYIKQRISWAALEWYRRKGNTAIGKNGKHVLIYAECPPEVSVMDPDEVESRDRRIRAMRIVNRAREQFWHRSPVHRAVIEVVMIGGGQKAEAARAVGVSTQRAQQVWEEIRDWTLANEANELGTAGRDADPGNGTG